MKIQTRTLKMVLAAVFLALAYVIPFLTGQIPEIGAMLCPMHIPVLLCGFVCGWQWGLAVGAVAPLFRSLTLGSPYLFPMALCMAFELAAYGSAAGIAYKKLPSGKPFIYLSLLVAMAAGRIVWGAAMFICMGQGGFGLSAFVAGAFTNAIPGIAAQIAIVPLLVMALERLGVADPKERSL